MRIRPHCATSHRGTMARTVPGPDGMRVPDSAVRTEQRSAHSHRAGERAIRKGSEDAADRSSQAMSARRKFAWFACAALTAPIGLFALSAIEVPADAASPAIVQQQSKIEATDARIRAKRHQLQFEATREADIRRQLGETTSAISSVQARIAGVQTRIDAALASEDRQK